ncbi:hypothetical protein RFI_32793 [Reticulomyxa filosa]|uniref:Uncharacterized protein n=1 Tax=Reticulomyxa filosa TaxID=46433 RepID=X6LRT5_RETFI|nr:hypothetical protein RFI_32793 [Reticulomyxa filosa]|eukprot:ETO04603.1 hypothetical protein RFI_32793 [Reticulomyxa filosa]
MLQKYLGNRMAKGHVEYEIFEISIKSKCVFSDAKCLKKPFLMPNKNRNTHLCLLFLHAISLMTVATFMQSYFFKRSKPSKCFFLNARYANFQLVAVHHNINNSEVNIENIFNKKKKELFNSLFFCFIFFNSKKDFYLFVYPIYNYELFCQFNYDNLKKKIMTVTQSFNDSTVYLYLKCGVICNAFIRKRFFCDICMVFLPLKK